MPRRARQGTITRVAPHGAPQQSSHHWEHPTINTYLVESGRLPLANLRKTLEHTAVPTWSTPTINSPLGASNNQLKYLVVSSRLLLASLCNTLQHTAAPTWSTPTINITTVLL